MRVERIEVECHRELQRMDWSPADLTVIRGDPEAIEVVAEAVFTLSASPRGWSDLPAWINALALPDRAVPDGEEAPTTRWRLRCAPRPGDDDARGAEYELGIYPPSAGLSWEVRYEFLRRFDDFDELQVLHREGGRVELALSPKGGAKAKPTREVVARDMSALGALHTLFHDPAVKPFAQPLALWSRYRRFAVGPDAPTRTAAAFPAFDERLVEGGGNLINALQNLVDLAPTRERLDAILRDAVPGHESLGFAMRDDGTASLAWRLGGRTFGAPELPDEALHALCLAAAVLATAPPPLLWFDEDLWTLPDACLPALARALHDLAGRAQVVLARPPVELCAAIAALDATAARPIEPAYMSARRGDGEIRLVRGDTAPESEGFPSR